jgi:O-antigen/teichoic acid export membrane protein
MTSDKPRTITVAKNTVWNLVAKGTDFLGNLLASVLIARMMGVEGFGQFSFVVAYVTLFSMGMDWGLEYILVREISRRPGNGRSEFGNILGLKLLFLMVLIPILIATNQGLAMTKGVRTAVYLAAAGIMVCRIGFTRVAEGVFLARDSMIQKTLATIFYQIVRLTGVAAVLWSGGTLLLLFAVLLAADLFQALVVGFWVHGRHIPISIRFNKQDVGFFFLKPYRWAYPCSAMAF